MLHMSNLEFNTLVRMLKERPEGIFVTDRYMAAWSESSQGVILIPGNYMHLNEEEVNQVLVENAKNVLKI